MGLCCNICPIQNITKKGIKYTNAHWLKSHIKLKETLHSSCRTNCPNYQTNLKPQNYKTICNAYVIREYGFNINLNIFNARKKYGKISKKRRKRPNGS